MKQIISSALSCFLISMSASAQWTTQNSGTTVALFGITFSTPDTGYACDENLNVIRTTDGGSTWNAYPQITGYGTYFTSKNTGFIYGLDIKRTNNAGVTWTSVFSAPVGIITTMDFATPSVGYAAGLNAAFDSTLFLKTLDSGKTWVQIKVLPGNSYSALDFYNSTNGCISLEIDIARTTTGGTSWNTQYTDPQGFEEIMDIHFPAIDTGYAVSDFSTILKTTDGGLNWTPQTNTITNYPLYSVFFTDSKNGWIAGGDGLTVGAILKTTNGGTTWTLSTSNAQTFQCVHFPTKNIGYACGTGGMIMKYTGVTGIDEPETNLPLAVYPNPSTGIFFVAQQGAVSIYNTMGQLVDQSIVTGDRAAIDISAQPKGIYFVKVVSVDKVYTEKVVIQ